MGHEDHQPSEAAEDNRSFRLVATLALGFGVGFAIACPAFLAEEFWQGRPLIDHHNLWWTLPAAIMALGFLIGGIIVGRRSRRGEVAFLSAAFMAAVTVWLIFVSDLIRRDVLGQKWNFGVEKLWFTSAAGAVLVGGLGGIIGHGIWSRREKFAREGAHV